MANLADDSSVSMAVHGAVILWHGVERSVQVLATGKRPLLGMILLEGSQLVVECADEGSVTVEPL